MHSILERMRLIPSTLLALSVSYALGSALEVRDTQSASTPTPIVFNPDQNLDGIDGAWSSFTVGIGTPPQYVRTFVSWASYQTWAIIPAGCNTTANYQDCADDRGYLYTESKSTTFQNIGLYALSLETNLGYQGNAIFGYDTVGLGGPGEEGPKLQHTVVGGMAYPDFYLGVFGINPKPTNFSTFNNPSTSYMTLLKDQKYIPSVSFGYTAGAPYRFTGVLASLTLGGYDASLFVENDVIFTFAPDNSRDVVAAIQSITASSATDSSADPTSLLPSPIYAYMDATVAEIWLPLDACKAFESAFGLVYDSETELYLVSNSLHQQLLKQNASITFTLGTDLSNGAVVSIELPYAAFDLTAKPPYRSITEQSYYFPLRRALNDTQYTIGRTFFQEAYITVDYETQTFKVSQCSWVQNAPSEIITITPCTAQDCSPYPGVSSGNSISGGAIAGIVVGVIAVLVVVGIGLFVWFKRHFQLTRRSGHEKLGSDWGSAHNAATDLTPIPGGRQEAVYPKAELAGSVPAIPMQSDVRLHSSGGVSPDGINTPRTPHSYFSPTSQGHDPGSPTSPIEGHGTHSSASTGGGVGTMFSCVSPMTPKEEPIYEMAGDEPIIREKDGKELSEKEAIAHREKVYNGVEPPTYSEEPAARRDTRRRVDPAQVVTGETVIDSDRHLGTTSSSEHRAFSFDQERATRANTLDSEEDLYS